MRDMLERTPVAGDSSFWYNLCLATIGASAALYITGRRNLSLFVGLWPPTFAAFGNRAEINEEIVHLVTGRPIQRLGGEQVTPRQAGIAETREEQQPTRTRMRTTRRPTA